MATPHANAIVDAYLKRLDHALHGLPRRRREEILQEFRQHIRAARDLLPQETDADVLNILERLGEPEALAADARERLGVRPPSVGVGEMMALLLLIFGGFVAQILPAVLGLSLVWRSRSWSRRDKRIATLGVLPVVTLLFLSLAALLPELHGSLVSGGPNAGEPPSHRWSVVPLSLLVLAPFAVGIYLARRVGKVSLLTGGVLTIFALLLTIPTAWAMAAPPRQYGHNQDPSITARASGAPAVDSPGTQRADGSFCRDFYETTDFGLVGTVHEDINVCSDGTRVKVGWGPDCHVNGFTFISVRCTVEYPNAPRPASLPPDDAFGMAGALDLRVDVSASPRVPPLGQQSSSFTAVSITPAGSFMEGGWSGPGRHGNVHGH